jgi:hypothetical protein
MAMSDDPCDMPFGYLEQGRRGPLKRIPIR